MRKLKKLLSFWSLSILFIIIFISFLKIIKSDIKLAHQGIFIYQQPFSWVKYNLSTSFKKSYSKLFNKYKEIGLSPRLLYVNAQYEKKLLSETPNSTKNWIRAKIYYDDKLKNIRMRYGGDNPFNWLLEKKRIRIKSNKLDLFGTKRYLEYFPFNIKNYFSHSIIASVGLTSTNVGLVELYVNGVSKGIFHEKNVLNEGFIRRNKLMPVNVYKGENHAAEKILMVNSNLFENSSLWNKISIFNKLKENDKSDLNFFLKELNSFNVKEKFDVTLGNFIDLNKFSLHQAYYILTQNYNQLWFHNMRLVIDPWKGQVDFIEIDPFISHQIGSKFQFDLSSNDLISFLNQSSEFNNLKYEKLWEFVYKEKILSKVFKKIDDNMPKILISSSRDPELNEKKIKLEINQIKKILLGNEKKIRQKLESKPKTYWASDKDYFVFQIEDVTPASNLELEFKEDLPKWIALDLNNNKIAEENEILNLNSKNSNILIPTTLFSNRVKTTTKLNNMNQVGEIKTIKTRFNFIIEKNLKPSQVKVKNKFSNQTFIVKKIKSINASLPNKYNIPLGNIFKSDKLNETKILSGKIIVSDDMVYETNVQILPGTTFHIASKKNIIFRKKVKAIGTDSRPIIFKKLSQKKNDNWGTIALVGKNTRGSTLENIKYYGGSGGFHKQLRFTSALSIHNTDEILIKNNKFYKSNFFDDVIHVVYCDKITLDNIEITDSTGDAIDIDVSNDISILNSKFINPGNDGIDFMESTGTVKNNYIDNAGDKGISIGENSEIYIEDNYFTNNKIAIAIKDRSNSKVKKSKFSNNSVHISAYPKNWRYGGGGNIKIFDSEFISKEKNVFEEFQKSNIEFDNPIFIGEKSFLEKKMKISKK